MRVLTCARNLLTTCSFLVLKLCFLSDNEKIVLVAESLKCLIYPFEWAHVYVPIVPASHLHLMEAPVTYLMGVTSHVSLEDQADIGILDIDNNKVTLPEDLPNLPNRDELINSINNTLIKPSASQPNDPFSRLKLTSFTPDPTPESPNRSFASRKLCRPRPPKLKILHQLKNTESLKECLSQEEKAQHISALNLTIRSTFLDHFCKLFQNYDKFVIYPTDKASWESNRNNLDNFERDVFLCDQAQANLTFLSRFLVTHMFSSFIDSKILASFDVPSDSVTHFDSKIEDLRKGAIDEIKSPITSERESQHIIYKFPDIF